MPIRRLIAALFASALITPARPGLAGEPEPSEAERLYRAYESLNTAGNLAQVFPGGEPPKFVQRQAELLQALGERPSKEAAPIALRIADEYLKRIEGLGPERFGRSPLKALQIPLVRMLAKHAEQEEVRSRLEALAQSPLVREYARGRALGVLAEQRLKAIPSLEDPTGKRRSQILFQTLLADLSFSQLLHAPARLRALAERVLWIVGQDPVAAARFLGPTEAPPRRYAADYVIAIATALKLGSAKLLIPSENSLLRDVGGRYVNTFRPEVLKEKYPSDLLGDTLLYLGGLKGAEPLATLLRDHGIQPRRPVEPAPEAKVIPEDAPLDREAVARLLAQTVAAAKNNQEAEADRLLDQLAHSADLPPLLEILSDAKTDLPTRAAVLRALAHSGAEDAVAYILDAARDSEDARLLEAVFVALTEVKSPAAIPALLLAIFDGTDARLGTACAQVIARLPGAEKAKGLLKAHADKDYEAIPILVALAKDWRSERSALAGLTGLITLGTPDAVGALFDLVEDKAIADEPGRVATLQRALAEAVGDSAEVPEIIAVALARLKAASPQVRLAAAIALTNLRDDETVRRALTQAARGEQDKDVAKALQTALEGPPKKR